MSQILRATELYNLEAERTRLSNALGGIGANVPQAAKAIHEARLANLDKTVSDLKDASVTHRLHTEPRHFRRLRRVGDPVHPPSGRHVDDEVTMRI